MAINRPNGLLPPQRYVYITLDLPNSRRKCPHVQGRGSFFPCVFAHGQRLPRVERSVKGAMNDLVAGWQCQ